MKRFANVALGVVTSIGGFVEAGSISTAVLVAAGGAALILAGSFSACSPRRVRRAGYVVNWDQLTISETETHVPCR